MGTKSNLRVLTFNAWLCRTPFGVNLFEETEPRLKVLPHKVAETGADVVALQEVWGRYFRRRLIKDFKKMGYPYFAFRSESPRFQLQTTGWSWTAKLAAPFIRMLVAIGRRFFGNGLLIVSRYPLDKDTHQMFFSRFTRQDEAFVVKGAIKTRVDIPGHGWIDVFNAHLGALTFLAKEKRYDKSHLTIRQQQCQELARWIERERTSREAILAVDLNCHYQEFTDGKHTDRPSREYALLTNEGLQFTDTYLKVNGKANPPAWTFDTRNPYVSHGHFAQVPSVVADYIFTRPETLEPVESKVVFTEPLAAYEQEKLKLRKLPKRLSDHYGVLTTFRLQSLQDSAAEKPAS